MTKLYMNKFLNKLRMIYNEIVNGDFDIPVVFLLDEQPIYLQDVYCTKQISYIGDDDFPMPIVVNLDFTKNKN